MQNKMRTQLWDTLYYARLPGGEADHGAGWSQHLPAQLGVSTHSLGTLYKLSVFSVYIVTPVVYDQAGVCNIMEVEKTNKLPTKCVILL